MQKQYLYGKVDYTSLVNARNFLAEILQNAHNDYEKTGAIQAFEFCYELSWKIMKKILIFHGAEATTARNVFRESAKLGLLVDAERWFSYLEKRNITVHCYRKEILDDLFANTTKEFLIDLDYLLKQLENNNTPFGEDLAVIKELEIQGLEQLLPSQLDKTFLQRIKQAQNYQQLVQVRNAFLSKHLAKNQSIEVSEIIKPIKKPNLERYIWISLLAISLVIIGGLLMKLRRYAGKKSSEK